MKTKQIVDLLLIEDRPEDAELALMALQESHMANSILWLKNGEEALDFLFARNEYVDRKGLPLPKMVLLDLKMPKIDGIEVLRELRSNPDTAAIPVVVLTTSREQQDLYEAYKLNVNSYIVKPVNFDGFMKSVRDIGFYWLILNEPPEN